MQGERAGELGGGVCACAKLLGKTEGGLEEVLTAVEAARVPGMPRGGGVGSNEFE